MSIYFKFIFKCFSSGKAAYSTGVRLLRDNITGSVTVGANYFMAYHGVLKKPDDYVNALKAARYYANKITQSWYATTDNYMNGPIRRNTVFPYRLVQISTNYHDNNLYLSD